MALAAWCGIVAGLCGVAARGEEAKAPPTAAEVKPAAAENQPTGTTPDVTRDTQPSKPDSHGKAAASTPATPKETKPAPPTTPVPNESGRLTFSFRYQPWQDVLDWFAGQAGLSLVMESPPPGTFNYFDTRSYTTGQALDVLNGVLLTKGYTLVRSGHMLVVVNLDDGIPPNLVPDVPLEELDQHGDYELIRVLFPVWNMTPELAAAEVQPLLGPQGKVISLPQARQIQVTETGGRLRTIRSVINAVEQPESGNAGMREISLKYVPFDAAMPTIRQMLGIPADTFATPDGSAQITKSANGEKLIFRGNAQQAARLNEVLRLIDVPEAARGINGAPQLEVYGVTTADPEAVVKVLQTIMHNDPSVVLTADKDAGHVVAFATPPQQATIKATIDQMQKEAKQVDVINLQNVDPQTAVLAINKLFGGMKGDEPDPKAPRVDADITTRSLMVRGTAAQVEQIRDLLRKLGETEEEGGMSTSNQHVRLLPLTGSAARSAVSQIEQIWPTMRQNKIRIVTPSATIQSFQPSGSTGAEPNAAPNNAAPADETMLRLQELYRTLYERQNPEDAAPASPPKTPDGADAAGKGDDRAADVATPARYRFVADSDASDIKPLQSTKKPTASGSVATPQSKGTPGAPITIAPGPGGTVIASDDLEALDELENLLGTVAGRSASSAREYSVFYLKNSKAATIAEVLNAIFGGGGGKDRGIIGDLASNALGDVGGGLMGDLLLGGSGGGGSFSSGAVDIVPDARLNALIVHAKPADLDTVNQLLQVLDQRSGPLQVEAEAQARTIPVINTKASDIAAIVQQVYQDRMAGGAGVMSPQDMMKMLKGGNNPEQQVQKMSIAVDSSNNALIVRAPDALFEEVKALVNDLDHPVGDSPQTTRVVSLKHTNSSAVQRTLNSLLNNVRTGTTTASTTTTQTTSSSSGRGGDDDDSPEERMRRSMRRNWEMMQEMRRAQESSERGGDRGDRSRFSRGSRGGGDSERGGDRGDRGR
jgi:type II secretory pathway component GspD/PulD (secretin)